MQADHEAIKRRLKTARGQIDGLIKMVEEDRYCLDISNQLLATQALLKRANEEVLRAHMLSCVKQAFEQGNAEEKIDEMTEQFRKNQIDRMQVGKCSDEGCVLYSEMLTDCERIGDHILNVGQEMAGAVYE